MDETRARDRIHQVADEIPVPGTPYPYLLAEGHRRTRRRGRIRVAALVVAAAAVVAVSVQTVTIITHSIEGSRDLPAAGRPADNGAPVTCPSTQVEAHAFDRSTIELESDPPTQIRVCQMNSGLAPDAADAAIVDTPHIAGIFQIIADESRNSLDPACGNLATETEFVLLLDYADGSLRTVSVTTQQPCDTITVGNRGPSGGGTQLATAIQIALGDS